MSVELGSFWIDNDSDLLVIVKSLEGNYDGKVKVVFNYIIRTGDKSVESASELEFFLKTKTKLVKSIEGDYSKGFKKGKEFNKDEQNLNYRMGLEDGYESGYRDAYEEMYCPNNERERALQEKAFDEGYDQAIDDLIESGVIEEEDCLVEEYSGEEYSDGECFSEYDFDNEDDEDDGEEDYCFYKEIERVLNSESASNIKSDEKAGEDLEEYNQGYEDGKRRGITLGYNKRDYEYSKPNKSNEDYSDEGYYSFKELERVLDSELASNIKSDEDKKEDLVNNPSHYNSDPSGVKCIEITRHRNNNIGNVIKYIWRNGLKDGNSNIQDLEKAAWYLNDEIQRLKGIER